MPRIREDSLSCDWIELDNPANWNSPNKSPEEKAELRRRGLRISSALKKSYGEKIDYSLRIIDRAFSKEGVTWGVAFSGGNDSHVLSYLCVEVFGGSPPHIMSNTRLEYPQIIRNVKSRFCELNKAHVSTRWALPDKRPREVWEETGIPLFSKEIASKYNKWVKTGNNKHLAKVPNYLIPKLEALKEAGVRITDKCCDELKKKPMEKLKKELGINGVFTGTRCQESKVRRLALLQRGSLYQTSKEWVCNPLSIWLKEDIEHFKIDRKIFVEQPPNSSNRSGCVNCAFGCHISQRKGEENSLQNLFRENRKIWEKTINDWGFKEACDIAGIATEPEKEYKTEKVEFGEVV